MEGPTPTPPQGLKLGNPPPPGQGRAFDLASHFNPPVTYPPKWASSSKSGVIMECFELDCDTTSRSWFKEVSVRLGSAFLSTAFLMSARGCVSCASSHTGAVSSFSMQFSLHPLQVSGQVGADFPPQKYAGTPKTNTEGVAGLRRSWERSEERRSWAGKAPLPQECIMHPGRSVCNVDKILAS
eukprot:1160130-Pelagomonas_calceolata.AAC.6